MGKITFMGAGSNVFAKNVIGDTLMTEALRDFEIALYDIDAERLDDSYKMICNLNSTINENRATIKQYVGVENTTLRSGETFPGQMNPAVPTSTVRPVGNFRRNIPAAAPSRANYARTTTLTQFPGRDLSIGGQDPVRQEVVR